MKTKTPKLPRYTGPKITFEDGQKSSLRKAGPAPKGWKYLKVGDEAPKESIVLTNDGWEGPNFCTGEVVRENSWLRAVPFKARKPSIIYFTNKGRSFDWVVKLRDGVYRDYMASGSDQSTGSVCASCVADLARGTYSTITRAEFLAAIKKFGLKEDGSKIAATPDYKAENVSLKASLAKLEGRLAQIEKLAKGS